MLKDITLGQYYPADSVIHRLNPRTKLSATLLFMISLFCFRTIWAFLLISAFLIGVIFLSRVPFWYMIRGLKSILMIMAVAAICNLFFTPGTVLVSFWKLTITEEGAKSAVFMLLRLSYLIIGTSLLTLTTTPNQLTDGLEKALHALTHIHVPVHEIAMMMSIALRFIPILTEETDKIMKAQMARGADFESGGLMKRAKNMIPLLVPLFVSAFRRANDLALAMEARCYRGGVGRTRMKPLHYEKRDLAAYLVLLSYMAFLIMLNLI